MSGGQVTGYIGKVFTKTGSSSKGPWALDNILMKDDQGNDIGWFGNGLRKQADVAPAFKEGDYVSFHWEENDKGYKNVKGEVEVKTPPAPAAAPVGASVAPAANTNHGMNYGNARNCAIQLVEVLLANDALPITKTQSAANRAVRYEEVMAAVDKLTVKFFNDGATYRLLETVADEGVVDTSGDGDLPDADDMNPEPTAEGGEHEPL